MSYCYYFGTYKKPVFELLEKGKIDQALTFIRDHRRRDDLCDRHRAELWILEAHCHQASHNLWSSELALEMAEEEIKANKLKGAILCFYNCAKAEQMIISGRLQSAVVCLKKAEDSAETDCQRGMIELDFSFINYRQGFMDAAHKYAERAKPLLKDDCGLLLANCQTMIKKTAKKPKGFWALFRFIFKPFLKLFSRKKEVEHSKFKTLVTIGAE